MTTESNIQQRIAVKAIIKNADGKILVLRQSAEEAVENANRFHPPGGIIEPGELMREALRREVLEELGLESEVGKILSVEEWQTNIRGQHCQFVGIFFECKIDESQVIRLDEESAGYEWIDGNTLERVDIVEPSKTVIKKALNG